MHFMQLCTIVVQILHILWEWMERMFIRAASQQSGRKNVFFFWNQLMQQRSEWQRILYLITILSSVNNSCSSLPLRQCTGEINIGRFGGGVATRQYCPQKLPMLLKNQRHDKI